MTSIKLYIRHIRHTHQTRTPVKSFDFMKTLSAEKANLREHGFRNVGSKMIDASKVVNQMALYGDQTHYSYVPGLPDLPIAKILSAGSDHEALQLFQLEYNSLTPLEKLVILQKLQADINASNPLLVAGSIEVFNYVSGKFHPICLYSGGWL